LLELSRGKYITVKGLKEIEKMLDDACGNIDNAIMALAELDNLPEEIKKRVEWFDLSEVVCLKNDIEQLMFDRIEKAREKVEKEDE